MYIQLAKKKPQQQAHHDRVETFHNRLNDDIQQFDGLYQQF